MKEEVSCEMGGNSESKRREKTRAGSESERKRREKTQKAISFWRKHDSRVSENVPITRTYVPSKVHTFVR